MTAGRSTPRAGPCWALDRLAGLSEPAALPVIMEGTGGLVVDRLVAAGHPVVPSPDRVLGGPSVRGASRAKSDAGDSDKLADSLGTDGHRLGRLDRSDPASRELQAWCGGVRTTCGPAPRPA